MHVFETPGPVLLRISTEVGTVRVDASGSASGVEVDVQPMRNNSASQEAVEQTKVELVERDGRYEVAIESPKRWLSFGRGASIAIRVSCPEGAELEVATATADVETRGSLAAVGAKTATGDLRFDVVSGDVAVNSASGDIAIGEIGGAGKVRSASGDVSVALGRGALSVNSASGDVRIDRALASISAATASGDIEIGAVEAGEVRLQSVSGDVRVGVREGLRVWIDASSVSGTISSDLPAEDGPPADGVAALEIHARTVSGDVGIVAATGILV
jgi:Putative adhesin